MADKKTYEEPKVTKLDFDYDDVVVASGDKPHLGCKPTPPSEHPHLGCKP